MNLLKNLFLLVLSFILRVSMFPFAIFAAATSGSLTEKVSAGLFSSWLGFPRAIKNMIQEYRLIESYMEKPMKEFMSTYSTKLFESVASFFNLLGELITELTKHPINSLLSALIVLLSFWFLAEFFTFIRQKGQGSFWTKIKRNIGNKIWNKK